ncbi:Sbal_3080 family lipoprotein [Massilia sp. CCM 9210]|uniref:Sbal_3080 family lipoprotein n=1 Tax=Massilia scottii TaxID=3057166 RepID=UPI00279698F8|nr:Sbal_3080 family lipoprotein [Massilia sp. CCM 9210]MDQ1812183.1 Sbal_3080 family lipoprotein [Massilia sp. CCM 9210]
MISRLACISVALLALSGCAIHQNVKPVERFDSKVVCIVDNPSVRATFFDAYERALTNKGYEVKKLASGASLVECPLTSTYTATWRWDLAMYMAYADIVVYKNAKPAGKATYDASRGGGNMGKFIGAEKKITELVDQLFPRLAGS